MQLLYCCDWSTTTAAIIDAVSVKVMDSITAICLYNIKYFACYLLQYQSCENCRLNLYINSLQIALNLNYLLKEGILL